MAAEVLSLIGSSVITNLLQGGSIMKMKQILLPFLVLLMLIGTLGACSSKDDSTVRQTTTTTERPVVQEQTTTTTIEKN